MATTSANQPSTSKETTSQPTPTTSTPTTTITAPSQTPATSSTMSATESQPVPSRPNTRARTPTTNNGAQQQPTVTTRAALAAAANGQSGRLRFRTEHQSIVLSQKIVMSYWLVTHQFPTNWSDPARLTEDAVSTMKIFLVSKIMEVVWGF